MTKTILVTDIQEVTRLHVSCPCGFGIDFPLRSRSSFQDECPNCGKKIPILSMAKLGDELANVHETLKKFEGVKITIETVEK